MSVSIQARFHDDPGAVLNENPPPVGTEVLLMLTDFGNPLVFAYGGRPQLERDTLLRGGSDSTLPSLSITSGRARRGAATTERFSTKDEEHGTALRFDLGAGLCRAFVMGTTDDPSGEAHFELTTSGG